MARVTVEDCIEKIPNRFALVGIASQRAKAINCGSPIVVERDNDKNAVVALREIASAKIDIDQLYEDLVASLQTRNKVDLIEEENLHAENQDNLPEELDLDNSSISLFNDDLDLSNAAFDDNITDEEQDK